MNEREPTLTDYLDVLYRYRVFIIIVVVITTLSALFFSYTAPKVYEGEVTLRVALRKVPTPLFTELGPVPQIDPVASEIQIIKSRTIAGMVVAREGLNIKFNGGITRDDFDTIWISKETKPLTFLISSISPGYAILSPNRDTIARFYPGDTVKIPGGFGFVLSKDGVSGEIAIRDFYKIADAIRNEIRVSRIRETDIISVKTKAKSPFLAARIANAYASSYLDYTLNYMRREARTSKEFIERQIDKMGLKLNEAEAKLKAYKESTGIFMLDEAANQLISEIAKLEANRAEAFVSKKEAEAKLTNLKGQLEEKDRTFGRYRMAASSPDLSNNPLLQALKNRLIDLEVRKSSLLRNYTERHPDVKKIDDEITRTKDEINTSVEKVLSVGPSATDPVYQQLVSQIIQTEAVLKASDAKIKAFDREIDRQNRKLSQLPETEVRLAQLKRNAKANEEIYTMLLNKREEARLAEASEIGDAQIIDPARPPRRPVSPRKKLNTILGFILGLVVGIGGAFLLEYVDTSIRRKEELEDLLGHPILAMIPEVEASTLIIDDPHSDLTEAFQILATNITYTGLKKPTTLLITSPVPQDGKSSVAINLALTLARLGNRVLIIDADLRRPFLRRFFGIRQKIGLSELILGRAKKKGVIHKRKGLSVLTTGTIPPNPPSLLGSEMFSELIAELKLEYDYLIFDSPPALGVSDTMIIAKVVDGTIVVTRYGKTPSNAIKETKLSFEHAGGRILGSVFNCLPPSPHYRSYYYYYHRYYREKHHNKREGGFWQRILSLKLTRLPDWARFGTFG